VRPRPYDRNNPENPYVAGILDGRLQKVPTYQDLCDRCDS
jgi:hypothetical protein